LSWWLDFEVETDPQEPLSFTVDGIDDVQRIGRDGAGGAYVLLPGSRGVLYASSEGGAGVVAGSLEEFVALMVECPYWHDVLKYSANGNLAEMRRAAAALEADFDDDEDFREVQEFARSQFELAQPADPIGALHRALSTSSPVVRSPHGEPYVSLFNSFTIDNNPMLRRQT
jgi:hypothetical protein